jgi:hypothetical protein
MAVFVACPQCAIRLSVPESLLGKKIRCASCMTVFDAQAQEAEPAKTIAGPLTSAVTDPSGKLAPPADDDLPMAPLDDEPVKKRKKRRADFQPDFDEYDDRRDREDRRRARRLVRQARWAPHRGGMVVVMGVLSVVLSAMGVFGAVCACFGLFWLAGLVLGILSWLFGHSDLGQMDRGNMDPEGRSPNRTGYICGIVGTSLSVVTVFCCMGRVLVTLAGVTLLQD